MTITKTDFVEGMRCPKFVWIKKNMPELLEKTDHSYLEKEGYEVGKLAEHCFTETVFKIPCTAEISDRIRMTDDAISAGQRIIAEASFQARNLYCQVDYLEVEEDGVIINEVKAKTSVRKTRRKNNSSYEAELKPEYLYDFSFQFYVLTLLGLNVKRVNCIHLNRDYKKAGALEYEKMFVSDDVTAEVKAYCDHKDHSIRDDIEDLEDILSKEEPSDMLTSKCKECELWEHCGAVLPAPNVFDLNGTFCRKRDSFYKDGLVTFPELFEADVLKEKGRMQVEAELQGEEYIDVDKIRTFLKTIRYPLYFLDFETYLNAIPVFDNQWPYEQIPFQYSLDVIAYPGADIEHREFLGKEGEDPRKAISESLVNSISEDACVIAYHKSFEGDRLQELSELFPNIAEQLLMIRDNLIDFETPFKEFWLYKKEMQGKSSIKKVLPALFPHDKMLDYHNLAGVQRGDEAMEMFLKLPELDETEKRKQRAYMLRYCRLDTFAMIKAYEALLQATDDPFYGGVVEAAAIYAEQMKSKDAREDKLL